MSRVYLCSHPPFDCTCIHPTPAVIVEHLKTSASHPSTAAFRRSHGREAFHALVVPGTLHLPDAEEGILIYHCTSCSSFFTTQASALDHWTATHPETATPIIDASGEEGLRNWLCTNHARILRLTPADAPVPTPVAAPVPAVFPAPAAAPVPAPAVAPNVAPTPARPQHAGPVSHYYFNGDLRDVNINPAPPPTLMVHFRAPLAPADLEVPMTARTVHGFAALLKRAYTRAWDAKEAEAVDWEGVFRAGMQVRCDTRDGGAMGVVVQRDQDVGDLRRDMLYGEGWVGDVEKAREG